MGKVIFLIIAVSNLVACASPNYSFPSKVVWDSDPIGQARAAGRLHFNETEDGRQYAARQKALPKKWRNVTSDDTITMRVQRIDSGKISGQEEYLIEAN